MSMVAFASLGLFNVTVILGASPDEKSLHVTMLLQSQVPGTRG